MGEHDSLDQTWSGRRKPHANGQHPRRQDTALPSGGDDAATEEKIIIARAGKPVARLVPLAARQLKRVLGLLAGRPRVPADFDAPLPGKVLDGFEGR